jgi:hypothetical protein
VTERRGCAKESSEVSKQGDTRPIEKVRDRAQDTPWRQNAPPHRQGQSGRTACMMDDLRGIFRVGPEIPVKDMLGREGEGMLKLRRLNVQRERERRYQEKRDESINAES